MCYEGLVPFHLYRAPLGLLSETSFNSTSLCEGVSSHTLCSGVYRGTTYKMRSAFGGICPVKPLGKMSALPYPQK